MVRLVWALIPTPVRLQADSAPLPHSACLRPQHTPALLLLSLSKGLLKTWPPKHRMGLWHGLPPYPELGCEKPKGIRQWGPGHRVTGHNAASF